ncbi:MAG: hypothetical protein KUL88_04785 [Rhizobium sp.]|nr:hypothetical protein [Rhizobium sp.]
MKILNSGSGFPRPLYGQRFYSNPTLSAWLAGKPLPAKPAKPVELSPEALRMPWLSDKHLEHLLDKEDLSTGGRYLTLTARLRRFFAIRTGTNLHPVYRTVKRGAVVYFENDGPTDFWLAWTARVWANMPPDDSDIFARPAHSESPKHKHMAESMKPLLAYRNMSSPIRFGGTNWMQPDNDNYEDAEARPAIYPERRLRLTDKPDALKRYAAKAGPTVEWRHAKLNGVGEVENRPTDVTLQLVVDKRDASGSVTKSHRTIVRAGKLRIANGQTTAFCPIKGDDLHVDEGTILYLDDRFGELLGPDPKPIDAERSQSYWMKLLSNEGRNELAPLDYKKTGKMRRKEIITEDERCALLAGPLPPITYYKPGIAHGTPDIGSQFLGGWISNPKGKQPPERWQDISDEIAREAEFQRWADALPEEERKALHLATTASTFKEIGQAFGKQEKNAERHGKKVLKAANDNLRKIMAAA